MAGPVQEVTLTGGPGAGTKGAGFVLRWATSPRSGADLETPWGRLAGFLVADGQDGRGGQLFAAYRAPAEDGQPAQGVIRHGTVDQGLAAILGTPPAPHTRYGTREPEVRFVREYTPAGRSAVRQYEGPGGRRVDIAIRGARPGRVRNAERDADAEARRRLGLGPGPAAAPAPEPEM